MPTNELSSYVGVLPYWGFALATAGSFYGGTRWIGGHFKPEFKKDLTSWLKGTYESTWATQFCRLFDTSFGGRHFSLKRLVRSALASIFTVIVIYLLLGQVLGVLGSRTFGTIGFFQALLIGMAVNILPDYLSLIETRWLLERFSKVQSVIGQLALLLADLLFSAAIILAGIYAYSFLFKGQQIPSFVEIVALFSVFSIFFYSTFLSSAWAWVYCLSTWFIRLFTRLGLRRVLNIEKEPIKQIALVGAAIVLAGGLSVGPVFKSGEQGAATVFDEFVCSFDLKACFHAARSADDLALTVRFMELACKSEKDDGNCADRLDREFGNDLRLTSEIWRRACEGGYARGCRAYGYSLDYGLGMARDHAKATVFHQKACDGGDLTGCNNLGISFQDGKGVDKDDAIAFALYQKACDGGDFIGCNNLGHSFRDGIGVGKDDAKALALFRKGCDDGHLDGCTSAGWMYESGRGLDKDFAKAGALYLKSCDGGHMDGCSNLGLLYSFGKGVDKDYARALALFRKTCNAGAVRGCTSLGWIYEIGRGVDKDFAKARALYRKSCDGGHAIGCNNLGLMYEFGRGSDKDFAKAGELYRKGCDGGEMRGCSKLGNLYDQGDGVAIDAAKAKALYRKACDGGYQPAC